MAADFLEALGRRIERRREELHLSRAEIARRMPGKVNENQVYRWERGKHLPKPDTLEALADVLGVSVAELMAPEPDKTSTPDPFAATGPTTGRLEERLAAIEEQLRLLRSHNEARHAEVISRIDERTAPIQNAPPRRRHA